MNSDDLIAAESAWGQDLKSTTDLASCKSYGGCEAALVAQICSILLSSADHEIPRVFPTHDLSEYDRHSLNQGRFAWTLRLNENVRRVYEVIYQCAPEDLVVGMDRVFYSPKQVTHFITTSSLFPIVDKTNVHIRNKISYRIHLIQSTIYGDMLITIRRQFVIP